MVSSTNIQSPPPTIQLQTSRWFYSVGFMGTSTLFENHYAPQLAGAPIRLGEKKQKEQTKNNAGELHRMHLPWLCQEFTEFAHKLDLATINCLRKEKGPHYVKRTKLLELRRIPPIKTS
ncbi:uncharacterized protein VP01_1748g10 [Puccinia sorghi]|uniref:Uncharacterized protein n=1 Tax=Puccinia sorghi TaxID=27349 RepID=A0A0L6VFQ6_9BASI|nr:uncharacterized protein VP01_1748g10 [Puccinia sorghi]